MKELFFQILFGKLQENFLQYLNHLRTSKVFQMSKVESTGQNHSQKCQRFLKVKVFLTFFFGSGKFNFGFLAKRFNFLDKILFVCLPKVSFFQVLFQIFVFFFKSSKSLNY